MRVRNEVCGGAVELCVWRVGQGGEKSPKISTGYSTVPVVILIV